MTKELDQIEQIREQYYYPFRGLLDRAETDTIPDDPKYWWHRTARFLLSSQKEAILKSLPPPAQEFIAQYAQAFLEILKSPHSKNHLSLSHQAVSLMHEMSDVLMQDEIAEHELVEIKFLSFAQLLSLSDRFSIKQKVTPAGTLSSQFGIYSNRLARPIYYPIPNTNFVVAKGGQGRTILKIISGADPVTIEAEIPPNDLDWIVAEGDQGMQDVLSLGANLEGIEMVGQLDFQQLMDNRDLDLNCAFVTKDGIVFSQAAYLAAQTGKIKLISTKRGIYGTEKFIYTDKAETIFMLKNRAIMRYIKTLAENKAKAFDFLPINKQINLGIYWLTLAKRFSTKTNSAKILDRMFYLANQVGSVPKGQNNLYAVLDDMHQQYPFFNMDRQSLSDVGTAQWLAKKLIKQIDQKYRFKANIPSDLILQRTPFDCTPYEVNLDNYHANEARIAEISAGFESFVTRCRRRTVAFNNS